MRFGHRLTLCATTSALALGLAGTAHAQDSLPAAGQDTAPTGSTDISDELEPAAIEDFNDPNTIIVTATRRNESVQDVPIAVTVIGGDLVRNAGVQDIRQLDSVAPSVRTTTGQSSANATTIAIRGIGTAGDNPGFEPAVGVFIDGVFRARAGLALADLPPLERVEVLRGPQGTLFGRNTSAGALNIITSRPTFDLSAFGEVAYGNFDSLAVRGMVNVPVGQSFAVRVDGAYRERDGYIRDINLDRRYNNLDRYQIRAQGYLDQGPLTIRLIGDYFNTDEQCCGAIRVIGGPAFPALTFLGALNGLSQPSMDPSRFEVSYSPNRDLREAVEDYGFSGEINYELGNATLTSITAYRDYDARRNQDIDFSNADRAYREGYRTGLKDFTQEVRLQGEAFGGVLNYLVGGFYLNEELTLTDTVRFGTQADLYADLLLSGLTRSAALPTGFQFNGRVPGVPLFGQVLLATNPQLRAAATANPALFRLFNSPLPGTPAGSGQNNDNYQVDTDAFAIFTHNIISLTDQLKLTLGLRYNNERKKIAADLNSTVPNCDFFLNPANGPLTSLILQNVPAAFLINCNPTINTEFNGQYGKTRKEDRFTGTAKIAFEPTPDLLFYGSYDRGYKSGGFNLDRATFDSRLLGGNGAQIEDLEFEEETVNSYEVGAKWTVTRGVTLNLAAFYANYDDLQVLVFSGTNFVVQNVPKSTTKGIEAEASIRPASDLGVQLGYTFLDAGFDANQTLLGNLAGEDGKQFGNQPENTVTAAVSYTPQVSNTLKGLLFANVRSISERRNIALTGTPADRAQGYALVNARVGIGTIDERFQLEAFAENLFDVSYPILGFSIPEQPGSAAYYPGQPRFYGVKLRVGF